jgi:Antibiotic biosynthesis monooxygenase
MRFNVLQDAQDQNVYYFYEVYRDEAALEAHRAAPHYAVWRAAADTLDGTPEATRCQTVFPRRPGTGSKSKTEGVRFAMDSPLEGGGFELVVPL